MDVKFRTKVSASGCVAYCEDIKIDCYEPDDTCCGN
jgi:hypothetical protein